MEVLGGLVVSPVGVDAAGPEAGHEVRRDHPGRPNQLQQQVVVGVFEGEEGFDVLPGEEDDMVFPERIGVVEVKDPLVLKVDRDVQKAFQNRAAIKITGGIVFVI